MRGRIASIGAAMIRKTSPDWSARSSPARTISSSVLVLVGGVSREAWRSTSFSQDISPAWLFKPSMASGTLGECRGCSQRAVS